MSDVCENRNPNMGEASPGIAIARKLLQDNGNPPPEFRTGASHVLSIVRSAS